jgi:hypothetical protein
MAQAFSKQPKAISFSDNPLVFEWYEGGGAVGTNLFDAATTTDFYFEVKLYVNTVLFNTYRVEIGSRVTSGGNAFAYAKFDASDVLKFFVNANQVTEAIITPIAETQYYITFTPKYLNAGTPTTGSTTTSVTKRATKGKLTKKYWIDYVENDLFKTSLWGIGTGGSQFFTQFPRNQKYYVGLEEDVYLFYANTIKVGEIKVSIFDNMGVVIKSNQVYAYGGSSVFTLFNIAPKQIADNFTGIAMSDFDNAAYYTVNAVVSSTIIESETFTFWIDRDCERYTNTRLYFLAKTGTIEAFTFKLVSRPRATTDVMTTKRQWGAWNGANYEFDLKQGETQTTMVMNKETLQLESDWLNEEVQHWLVENLYTSPYVIMERDGVMQRVNVMPMTYEKKTHAADTLINEILTVEYSVDNSSMLL